MFKKMNQMVDHFPAFRKLRVKSAERMGQAGILRVVDQFMGHLMSAQSLFKIQSITLKIISLSLVIRRLGGRLVTMSGCSGDT